jgi:hypothetical protein
MYGAGKIYQIEIFLFLKTFYRRWRQKRDSLNMKSVLKRYTITKKTKKNLSLKVTVGLKFFIAIEVGTSILTAEMFRSKTD